MRACSDQIRLPFDDTPKRLCARCRQRQVYLDIKTMDYCEPCIWDVVKTDMESLGAMRFDNLHPVGIKFHSWRE
jgi:hypothetical protein